MAIPQLPQTPNVGPEVPNTLWKWLIEMGNRLRQLIDFANKPVAAGVPAHAPTHASGGGDVLTPSDIGAAPAFRGCRIYNESGGSQSIAAATNTKVAFNTTAFDTNGFYDSTTDKIVIPAGVSYVELTAEVNWTGTYTAANSRRLAAITKNGGNVALSACSASNGNTYLNVSTGPISVSAGDYFELFVLENDTAAKTITQDTITFLSMKVLA